MELESFKKKYERYIVERGFSNSPELFSLGVDKFFLENVGSGIFEGLRDNQIDLIFSAYFAGYNTLANSIGKNRRR